MARVSCTTRPDARQNWASSLGRRNLLYSCVPVGSILRMYSAATMARPNDLMLRFNVEKKTQPPGLTKLAQACTTDAGLGTCSSISMQVTTSKLLGDWAARASAEISW